ncbi:MAG: knotted carbamoyltransferase YgeW [bacterium]|nr:knotted carbamoyltransferase YgeW [bacterium]
MYALLDRIETKLEDLKRRNFALFRRDFLLSWDKNDDDIVGTLILAEILQELYRDNVSLRAFETGLAVSLFRDKSTRTRLAFSSACDMLGLAHQEVDEQKSQIAHGETTRETANMISFLSEVIGIRDDMFFGRGHAFMREVAAALGDGFAGGILNHRPAVINLQCDLDHPTQTLSDLLHLKRFFGGIERLRGKRIVMSWAYSPSYGKPLSVPQGVVALMSRFGMDVVLAHPQGYDLSPDVTAKAARFAADSGGSFRVLHDMREAFRDADAVYPKSWASYRVMERRAELLKRGDLTGLGDIERECLDENARHRDWHCDEEKIALTRNGSALYMHCLPADVQGVNCEAGEVSRQIFDRYRLETYREARHKPFIIAAMIILCCFRDPISLIDGFYRRKRQRAL